MPIKRRLIPHECLPPRPRRQAGTQARETRELRPTAGFGAIALFPALDLGPGPLVDGVVDRDDGGHVARLRVEGFPAHGVEEHLLRGVDPVSGGFVGARVAFIIRWTSGHIVERCAGNGADFAGGAEFELGEDAGGGLCRGGLVEGGGVAGCLDKAT